MNSWSPVGLKIYNLKNEAHYIIDQLESLGVKKNTTYKKINNKHLSDIHTESEVLDVIDKLRKIRDSKLMPKKNYKVPEQPKEAILAVSKLNTERKPQHFRRFLRRIVWDIYTRI